MLYFDISESIKELEKVSNLYDLNYLLKNASIKLELKVFKIFMNKWIFISLVVGYNEGFLWRGGPLSFSWGGAIYMLFYYEASRKLPPRSCFFLPHVDFADFAGFGTESKLSGIGCPHASNILFALYIGFLGVGFFF